MRGAGLLFIKLQNNRNLMIAVVLFYEPSKYPKSTALSVSKFCILRLILLIFSSITGIREAVLL